MRSIKVWSTLLGFAAALSAACMSAGTLAAKPAPKASGLHPQGEKVEVLCSFFPIYVFTKNVVGDRPNINVSVMIPSEKGCPHDYDLTPEDIKKIARANVFVLNGGGIEEFGDEKVKKSNPKIKIIDSSAKIKMLEAAHDHDHDEKDAKHDHKHDHDHKDAKHDHKHDHDHKDAKHDHKHDHDHDHDKDHKHADKAKEQKKDDHDHGHHHHGGKNPHFFSSPTQAALQVEAIAEKLSEIDPDGASVYKQNAATYAAKLRALAGDFKKASEGFQNKKIVTIHEVFDYLARDIGLEVTATIDAEPGKDPSASRMRELIQSIKTKKPAAVFTEPQYSEKAATMISKEAKIRTGQLDPVASGPTDAPLDYYETTMRKNLETLKSLLGGS